MDQYSIAVLATVVAQAQDKDAYDILGQSAYVDRRPYRSIAVGIDAEAPFDDSIALGYKVCTTQEGQVIIGNESSRVVITPTYEDPVTGIRKNCEKGIIISGIDIIKELESLGTKVSELRELFKIQQEIVNALRLSLGDEIRMPHLIDRVEKLELSVFAKMPQGNEAPEYIPKPNKIEDTSDADRVLMEAERSLWG